MYPYALLSGHRLFAVPEKNCPHLAAKTNSSAAAKMHSGNSAAAPHREIYRSFRPANRRQRFRKNYGRQTVNAVHWMLRNAAVPDRCAWTDHLNRPPWTDRSGQIDSADLPCRIDPASTLTIESASPAGDPFRGSMPGPASMMAASVPRKPPEAFAGIGKWNRKFLLGNF